MQSDRNTYFFLDCREIIMTTCTCYDSSTTTVSKSWKTTISRSERSFWLFPYKYQWVDILAQVFSVNYLKTPIFIYLLCLLSFIFIFYLPFYTQINIYNVFIFYFKYIAGALLLLDILKFDVDIREMIVL